MTSKIVATVTVADTVEIMWHSFRAGARCAEHLHKRPRAPEVMLRAEFDRFWSGKEKPGEQP